MSFYIGIEDLAANALIEILQKQDEAIVTYECLENYGAAVVQVLMSKGEKAVLILSREETNAMFRNYSEFFEEVKTEDGLLGIKLKDGKTVDDLVAAFRGYLAWDVLMAFIDTTALAKLKVS